MRLLKTLTLCMVCLTVKSSIQEIEVYVVAHSHMDAGWLFTIDEYYDLGVNRILSSVIQQMDLKPHYKYTHGDIYYFKRWYEEQPAFVK